MAGDERAAILNIEVPFDRAFRKIASLANSAQYAAEHRSAKCRWPLGPLCYYSTDDGRASDGAK